MKWKINLIKTRVPEIEYKENPIMVQERQIRRLVILNITISFVVSVILIPLTFGKTYENAKYCFTLLRKARKAHLLGI